MTAFLAHPAIFIPLLILAVLGLLAWAAILIDAPERVRPIAARHPGTRAKHWSTRVHLPLSRRPAPRPPRPPHVRQPVLRVRQGLTRLASARHFPAGRRQALTAADEGTVAWFDVLHPERSPRRAWVQLCIRIGSLEGIRRVLLEVMAPPVDPGRWPGLARPWADETGSFSKITEVK